MEPDTQESNIDEMAASIASDLFPSDENAPLDDDAPPLDEPAAAPAPEVVARPAPKSWAKETHEIWGKLPPQAQDIFEQREKQMLDGLQQYKEHNDFGRTMREVFTPYKAVLAAQGIDEVKASQALLNAHYRLSTMPAEQKLGYLAQIAQTYGIQIPGLQQQQQPVDPRFQTLEQQVHKLTSALTEREQRQFDEARTRTTNEVTAFAEAKDDKGQPAHPYFDEVANDIIAQIQAGASLQDAYDKAVWANPVTRKKEIARLQKESEVNLKEKAKNEALEARRASSSNVRSRDTRKAPTEPLGKMDDTLKETLDAIRSRSH